MATAGRNLGLKGDEQISISGLGKGLKPRKKMIVEIKNAKGKTKSVEVLCRIDTVDELDYFRNGGILSYVLRNLANAA